MTTKVIKR